MKTNLERFTVMCLSTEHVTRDTCDEACADAIPGAFTFGGETGFFCYVPEGELDVTMPPDLAACIAFGRRWGARYILVDRDGPVMRGLPVYVWEDLSA